MRKRRVERFRSAATEVRPPMGSNQPDPSAARTRNGSLRRAAIGATARALRSGVRVVGAGGGTSLPGLFLERFDPGFLRSAAARSGARVVVVSGTNGKTTTASMIRHILRDAGNLVAGNEGGSNLTRGVLTTYLDVTNATDHVVLEA